MSGLTKRIIQKGQKIGHFNMEDLFKIVGSYKGSQYEEINIVKGLEEAKQIVSIYRLTYGSDWSITYYNIS